MKSQAISSSDDTSAYSQPCFSMSFCKFSILLLTLSPVALSGKNQAFVGATSGRSCHIRSITSPQSTSSTPLTLFFIISTNSTVAVVKSNAILGVSESFFTNSKIDGTPSSPAFISTVSVALSCSAAWIKYLPSVQRYAPSLVTTSVPALPVNPQRNARVLK